MDLLPPGESVPMDDSPIEPGCKLLKSSKNKVLDPEAVAQLDVFMNRPARLQTEGTYCDVKSPFRNTDGDLNDRPQTEQGFGSMEDVNDETELALGEKREKGEPMDSMGKGKTSDSGSALSAEIPRDEKKKGERLQETDFVSAPLTEILSAAPAAPVAPYRQPIEKTTILFQNALREEGFSKFEKLPREIQSLIWGFALDDTQHFLEAVYDSALGQFELSGPPHAILSVCGPSGIVNGIMPIHLWSHNGRHLTPVGPPPTHYLRPEKDILYIPILKGLAMDSFLGQPENQCIQHIGITLPVAYSCQDYFYPHNLTPVMQLVLGLKNLKTIHIIEGSYKGSEMSIDRTQSYTMDLVDVKDRDPALGWNIVKPWDSKALDRIVEIFKKLWTRLPPEWNPPELIGKKIKREKFGASPWY